MKDILSSLPNALFKKYVFSSAYIDKAIDHDKMTF